jgi:NADPH-dependent glutamate synthase beta subunit-like oxidoreductase
MSNGRTHRPEVDHGACSACGGCTWACPARVLPSQAAETDSLRGALFGARPYPGKPADLPPCRMACPLGQDVPGYIAAIARGDLESAARIIRDTNALPSVCGRVCVASCMRACSRAAIDEGLDIRGLKRFAVAAVEAAGPPRISVDTNGAKVAVVGGGPAGLAAAHRLLQLGLRPVVFEAGARAGGLLVDCVAPFVLPEVRVAADVARLEADGVEIRTGVRAGGDIPWEQLETDHAAVLIATGARRGLRPALAGNDLQGVTDAVTFGRRARSGGERIQGGAVVLGGGKAALQCARAARRLGADPVSVVHAAVRDLWPADADDRDAAEDEGVTLLDGRAVALEGDRALAAVRVRAATPGKADAVGRIALRAGAEQRIAAVLCVAAVDRRPAPGDAPTFADFGRGPLGTLIIDGSGRLSRPRWYAAGEAATGAATVVDSMATGRRAAEAIARDLRGEGGTP